MKTSCNVIKDILPLYVEGLASEDTRKIVEDHIDECGDCKKELEEMKSSTIPPMDVDTQPIERVRDKLRKKNSQTIILTTIITTLVIVIVIIAYLTSPDYLNLPETVSIVGNSEGALMASFDDRVTGYEIMEYTTDFGYSYDITTWDSIWGKIFSRNGVESVVLNPDGQHVDSVYYYYTVSGWSNSLIYGRDQNPGGGIMNLPRLALAYYLLIAVGLIVISLISMRIFSKNIKVKERIKKIIYLPIAYIIGHILIKGFTTSTYSMQRDFLTIILVMIGIYVVMLGVDKLYKERF